MSRTIRICRLKSLQPIMIKETIHWEIYSNVIRNYSKVLFLHYFLTRYSDYSVLNLPSRKCLKGHSKNHLNTTKSDLRGLSETLVNKLNECPTPVFWVRNFILDYFSYIYLSESVDILSYTFPKLLWLFWKRFTSSVRTHIIFVPQGVSLIPLVLCKSSDVKLVPSSLDSTIDELYYYSIFIPPPDVLLVFLFVNPLLLNNYI